MLLLNPQKSLTSFSTSESAVFHTNGCHQCCTNLRAQIDRSLITPQWKGKCMVFIVQQHCRTKCTCFVSFVKGDFRLWMFPFHFNDQKSRLENHRFYTILAPGPMLHLIFSHWLPPVRCHNTMEHLKQVSSVASSESVPKLVDHLTGPWVTGSSEWWGR